MYIIILKIKNHKKVTHLSLKFNKYLKKNIFFKKYNCMSKIFHKINLQFYYNVTTHNEIYDRFSYSIITHFIPNNKEYHLCHNPH